MLFTPPLEPLAHRMRAGFDLVQVSRIKDSLRLFGNAFRNRVFTQDELVYAGSGSPAEAERLAARFAAKEAVIKALQLCETGLNWRDIEVIRQKDGDCTVALHGEVAAIAAASGASFTLSMSHEGDYAGAFVVSVLVPPVSQDTAVNKPNRSLCGAS